MKASPAAPEPLPEIIGNADFGQRFSTSWTNFPGQKGYRQNQPDKDDAAAGNTSRNSGFDDIRYTKHLFNSLTGRFKQFFQMHLHGVRQRFQVIAAFQAAYHSALRVRLGHVDHLFS